MPIIETQLYHSVLYVGAVLTAAALKRTIRVSGREKHAVPATRSTSAGTESNRPTTRGAFYRAGVRIMVCLYDLKTATYSQVNQ